MEEKMKAMDNYMVFMLCDFSLRECRNIFNGTGYDPDYIFNNIWIERAKKHADTFWTNVDKNIQKIIFEYAQNFYKK